MALAAAGNQIVDLGAANQGFVLSGRQNAVFPTVSHTDIVAFVSDAYPACADEACNARTRDAAEKDPVKVHTLSRLPFRHWRLGG